MITIIDYGAGNIRSVVNAVSKLGYQPEVTNKPGDVLKATAVIFPGVGAATDTMHNLEKSGMLQVIRQLIAEDRPLFAVCLGMQILLSRTEEGGGQECLGIIPGVVRRLPTGLKVPHIGWNQVKQKMTHPVFAFLNELSNPISFNIEFGFEAQLLLHLDFNPAVDAAKATSCMMYCFHKFSLSVFF